MALLLCVSNLFNRTGTCKQASDWGLEGSRTWQSKAGRLYIATRELQAPIPFSPKRRAQLAMPLKSHFARATT